MDRKKNFKKNLIYISSGEEAGIKSISLKFQGDNAYGFLKMKVVFID